MHQLAAFIAKDASTQNAVSGGVDDDLHQAQRFTFFDGTGDGRHGEEPHLEFFSGGARLSFGDSNSPQLRVGEECVGEITVLDGLIFPFDQVGVDDLVVVVGDVGERWATLDVAQGPNSRDVGFHARIGLDVAAIVSGDSGFSELQIGRGWLAAGGDQKM